MFFTDSYQALRRGERLLALRYFVISILTLAIIGLPLSFFMLRRFEASATFHPERAALSGLWRAPQNGIDAVVVAAQSVLALQNIRSRRIDPLEPLVITVGTINGGTRFNIIAGEVKMTGTMRTLNNEVRERAVAMMRETLQNVTAAYGATFELNFEDSNPVTYNEPSLVEETLPTIRRVVGD